MTKLKMLLIEKMAEGDFDFTKDIVWLLKRYDDNKTLSNIEYDRVQRIFDKAKSVQHLVHTIINKCGIPQ